MSAIEVSTFTDLLTDMAEKLGETSVNTDNRRKRMINNAYNYLCSEDLWWWLEAIGSDSTADVSITSITRSSTIATVTTGTAHGYVTGDTVAISGANESSYNGSFTIVVTGTTTFTYVVSGSPTTPATGTITASALTYDLPSDFRAFHPRNPVKVGTGWYFIVPFENVQQYEGSSGVVQLPQVRNKKPAYIYGTSLHFIQTSMTAGQTIVYYYYKEPTLLDTGTDTPLVPKLFREAISLLAAGNYLKTQGGPESVEGNDYLSLYDQMVSKMRSEQDNRRTMGVKRRALDPEEAQVYGE